MTAPASIDAWGVEPKLKEAIHDDELCRSIVDAVHDEMANRRVTTADMARHLGTTEDAVRAALSDPVGAPLHDLVRIMTPLGLTLVPSSRA